MTGPDDRAEAFAARARAAGQEVLRVTHGGRYATVRLGPEHLHDCLADEVTFRADGSVHLSLAISADRADDVLAALIGQATPPPDRPLTAAQRAALQCLARAGRSCTLALRNDPTTAAVSSGAARRLIDKGLARWVGGQPDGFVELTDDGRGAAA